MSAEGSDLSLLKSLKVFPSILVGLSKYFKERLMLLLLLILSWPLRTGRKIEIGFGEGAG